MLLVLPISVADAHLAPSLAEVFRAFGGLSETRALVVASAASRAQALDFIERLDSVFKSVGLFVVPGDPSGWPQGPNAFFTATVDYLHRYQNDEPWYWFELDCTPLKPDWLDLLTAEYEAAEKPFMGVVNESWFSIGGEVRTEGQHMVGTGIYPPQVGKYSDLHRFAADTPWDVFWRWAIMPHVHGTQLIQHNWGTGYYRWRDGRIICDQIHKQTGPARNQSVSPEAVVLHGCKDNSLRELMLAGMERMAA